MKNQLSKAWNFLQEHKVCNVETISTLKKSDLLSALDLEEGKVITSRISFFERGLNIMVVKVDPLTDEINTVDLNKNTKERVWLELSTPLLEEKKIKLVKDVGMDLYGSGDTFEDALINLADRVRTGQGEDLILSAFTVVR